MTDAWIDQVFAAAEKSGAAIFAIPVAGTLKRVDADHVIEETVSREGLWEAQTPQVFRRQLLLDAYAKRAGFQATDEAQLVERIGHPVTVVPGSVINMKITTKEDQRLAEQALKALPKPKLPGGGIRLRMTINGGEGREERGEGKTRARIVITVPHVVLHAAAGRSADAIDDGPVGCGGVAFFSNLGPVFDNSVPRLDGLWFSALSGLLTFLALPFIILRSDVRDVVLFLCH